MHAFIIPSNCIMHNIYIFSLCNTSHVIVAPEQCECEMQITVITIIGTCIIILIVVLPIHENIGRRVNESRVGHSRSATVRCRDVHLSGLSSVDWSSVYVLALFSRDRLTNHNIISLSRHVYRMTWERDTTVGIILNILHTLIHRLYSSEKYLGAYKFFHKF